MRSLTKLNKSFHIRRKINRTTTHTDMAPTLHLSPPSVQEAQHHPREAALYYQLVEQGTTSPKVQISSMYDVAAAEPANPSNKLLTGFLDTPSGIVHSTLMSSSCRILRHFLPPLALALQRPKALMCPLQSWQSSCIVRVRSGRQLAQRDK